MEKQRRKREENRKNERDEREISGEIGGVKYIYIYIYIFFFFLQYCEQCNSMFRIVL